VAGVFGLGIGLPYGSGCTQGFTLLALLCLAAALAALLVPARRPPGPRDAAGIAAATQVNTPVRVR
jgi:hypothetical protein